MINMISGFIKWIWCASSVCRYVYLKGGNIGHIHLQEMYRLITYCETLLKVIP